MYRKKDLRHFSILHWIRYWLRQITEKNSIEKKKTTTKKQNAGEIGYIDANRQRLDMTVCRVYVCVYEFVNGLMGSMSSNTV